MTKATPLNPFSPPLQSTSAESTEKNLPPPHQTSASDTLSETLYVENDAYFDSMLQAISQAKFQIEMEAYIYESTEIGQRFVDAFSEAALRGVSVRVIVDGAGVDDSFTATAQDMINKGVKLKIYRPLPWRLAHWKFALIANQGLAKFWRLLSNINRRNHRKMLIVDQQGLWLGSMNISQSHLSEHRGGKGWRDTGVAIAQQDLRLPLKAFNMAWNNSSRKYRRRKAEAFKHSPYLFNFTRSLRALHHDAFLNRIEQAQSHIWVTNAYFVPDNLLLKQLEQAALRNVDVRILLPKRSDVFFMPWVSSVFFQRLIKAGVRVYEYLPTMLHAKTLVIDDWALVGSSNLNRRSLVHDLEVDYCLQLNETVEQLKVQYRNDLEMAEELDHDTLTNKKQWQRWLGILFLLLLGRWL
jgi:cardiolipin synthase